VRKGVRGQGEKERKREREKERKRREKERGGEGEKGRKGDSLNNVAGCSPLPPHSPTPLLPCPAPAALPRGFNAARVGSTIPIEIRPWIRRNPSRTPCPSL
jgi:hypothetical protein